MDKFNNNTLSNQVKKSGALIGVGEKKNYQQPYTAAIAITLVCLSYLTKFRLIPESTIKDWAIASTPDGNILFRFYEKRGDQFAHVYSKQRLAREAQGDEPKTKQDAKTKPILYGSWLVADDAKQLIITEGEIDALTVYSAGIRNVVSLPTGTNNLEWIDLQFEWLERFENIVLWFDNDAAGKKAVKEVSMRLGRHRISLVEAEHKDANEMLTTVAKNAGVDEALKQIKAAVENAIEFPVEDLVDLADYEEEKATNDTETTLTKWGAIDAATKGMHGDELWLVFGDNGSGKSTALGNLICEQLENQNKVLLYSGEMGATQVRGWLEGMLAGPDALNPIYDEASGATDWVASDETQRAMRDWYRGRLWLYRKFGGLDFDDFFDACEYAVKRHGIKMIVVDSITTAVSGDDMYTMQGLFAARCREFASEYNVAVVVLMHVTAESLRDGGELKPPTKAAIRGAHAVSDYATHILGVWRVPEEVKRREPNERKPNHFYGTDNVLVLLKNRDRGELVTARMEFDIPSKRMYMQSDPDARHRRYSFTKPASTPSPVNDVVPIQQPLTVALAAQAVPIQQPQTEAPAVQETYGGDMFDEMFAA